MRIDKLEVRSYAHIWTWMPQDRRGPAMRKLFFWFGVFALGVILLAGGGIGYLAYLGHGLDREGRSYAEATVVAVTSRWDTEEMLRRSTTQLARSLTREQLASMFDWFSVLGPLSSSPVCAGNTAVFASVGQGRSTTGQYACSASYREGNATINLAISKQGDVWKTNGFQVNSPILLAHKPVQKS